MAPLRSVLGSELSKFPEFLVCELADKQHEAGEPLRVLSLKTCQAIASAVALC
jgi:hypothetical protein